MKKSTKVENEKRSVTIVNKNGIYTFNDVIAVLVKRGIEIEYSHTKGVEKPLKRR